MRALTITKHPHGPRVHVAGQRIHHGAVGALAGALAITSKRWRPLLLLAVYACAHDRRDWRFWFAIGDAQAKIEHLV